MAQEKKAEKKKRPTALKRDLQSEKRRLHNREQRARVNTAVRTLERAIATGDAASLKEKLSTVYSLMDKSVKTGLFKANKASRLKSRLSARIAKA
jgi:small subunit ribosomal protein S20